MKINKKDVLDLYLLQYRLILAYLRTLKLGELVYIVSALITMPIIGYIILGVIGSFVFGIITAIFIYLHITKKIANGQIGIIKK
jgi:uncharacterized membrane protein